MKCKNCEYVRTNHEGCADCRYKKVQDFEEKLKNIMDDSDLGGALRLPISVIHEFLMHITYGFSSSAVDIAQGVGDAVKECYLEEITELKKQHAQELKDLKIKMGGKTNG